MYDKMTWQNDMNIKGETFYIVCCLYEWIDEIGKGKTLKANWLNEGAVGQMVFVFVGGRGLGGGGATLYSYIYNIFMWHKPINKDIVTG